MKFSDLIAMCVRNLTRRKFRTFLTVTGVVIGTCAIVVMISLGVGISESNKAFLNSRGDLTIIQVYGNGGKADSVLDDAAIAQIQAIPGVDVATPFMNYMPPNSQMVLYTGARNRYVFWGASWTLTGVYPEALPKLGYTLKDGVMFTPATGKKLQMVFGSMVVYDFEDTKKRWPHSRIDGWPDEEGNMADPFFNPLEVEYKLKLDPSKQNAKTLEYTMEAVGILDAETREYEKMWSAYMDINDLKKIKADFEKENSVKKDKNQQEGYEQAKVKALDINKVHTVEVAIQEMGFQTYSMESMREDLQKNAQQIQLILGLLGGVSLFVAAISITNTMIMSVYERTREIGVMKVLGCLVGNIRSVFLIEAGLIGFFGGVIGVAFSCFLSFLLNKFGGALGGIFSQLPSDGTTSASVIPVWLMLLGLIFATLIGLASGFAPANHAVKISALEAIKQE